MNQLDKNLGLILGAHFISVSMNLVFAFAQALYILEITGSSAAFSMVLVAATVPRALLYFPAGVLADRKNKTHLIVTSELLSGIAVILAYFAFAIVDNTLYLFVFLALILNGLNTIYGASVYALMPNAVGDQRLIKANAFQQTSRGVIGILAPVVGAALYHWLGMQWLFIINGISFFFGALLVAQLKPQQTPAQPKIAQQSVVEELKQGIHYLSQHHNLRSIFIAGIALQAIFDPMLILFLPYLALVVLQLTKFQLSLLVAGAAFSAVCAGLWLSLSQSDKTRLIRFFPHFVIAQGLLFGLWAILSLLQDKAADSWTMTFVLMLLLMAGRFVNTVQNIPTFSYFQQNVDSGVRGKIFGLFFALAYAVVPISLWLFGHASENMPWQWIPVLACGLILAIGFSIKVRH